jgi:hypothetical protein
MSQPGDVEIPFTVDQFRAIDKLTDALQANTAALASLRDYIEKVDARLTKLERLQAGLAVAGSVITGFVVWLYYGTSIAANVRKP